MTVERRLVRGSALAQIGHRFGVAQQRGIWLLVGAVTQPTDPRWPGLLAANDTTYPSLPTPIAPPPHTGILRPSRTQVKGEQCLLARLVAVECARVERHVGERAIWLRDGRRSVASSASAKIGMKKTQTSCIWSSALATVSWLLPRMPNAVAMPASEPT